MNDLQHFRSFVVLAETMHFGRAAAQLHLTQPPLSRQIAALEKSLGVRLLERSTRRVQLTAAGRQFLEDAKRTLDCFDQACRHARLAEAGERGELEVGFMMHAAFTVVPALARQFTARHPGVKLHLRETLPGLLPEEILAGRLDVGIMFSPPPPLEGLESRLVHTEPLCLAVPAGHKLAEAAGAVRPQALRELKFIAAPEEVSPSLRNLILEWFRPAGFVPEFLLEARLQQTLVSLVAESLGVALVPESLGKSGVPGVRFLPLEQAPRIGTSVIWRTGNLNPSLPLFLRLEGIADGATS